MGLARVWRSKLVYLACKSCKKLMASAFSANFGTPSSSARWQTILKFNDIWCGSSWTHARSVWPGRVTLASLLHAPVASKHFSRRKFRFRDAAAGNCSWQCRHWSFGFREKLVRKVESEYRSLKTHFLQDIAKFHVICNHISRFTREDVFEKSCQSGIFYSVPSLTFVGGLIVDSQRSKFHVADPTCGSVKYDQIFAHTIFSKFHLLCLLALFP